MKYGRYTLGQIEAVLNKLGGEEGVDRFLAGDREVVIKRHVINTKLTPYHDEEFFGLAEHRAIRPRSGGLYEWDADLVDLWHPSAEALKKEPCISGHIDMLRQFVLLNATVRDYLLKHPELVPSSWQAFTLCFFGTIFSGRGKVKYLPTIRWNGRCWKNEFVGVKNQFRPEMRGLMSKV